LLWLVIALAAVLLFWNLSGRCLWQDEAETALLGKNILRFGLPFAWDGKNLVSQEEGHEFIWRSRLGTASREPDGLWRWSPWIQYYVAAGSMALLGETTLGGRFLFVLAALASVPLTYLLALCLFGSVPLARLSALFLTLSVPFLLHARQCRWYSIAFLVLAVLLLSVWGLANRRKGAWSGLVASAVLLWYTNFFVALGLIIALALAASLYRFERRFLMQLLAGFAAAGALALPSVLFFLSFGSNRKFEWDRIVFQLEGYSGQFLVFLLPLAVAAILLYAVAAGSAGRRLAPGWRRTALFLMTICVIYIFFVALGPWAFFRYLTPLVPVTSILSGLAACLLFEKNRWVGAMSVGCLLLTDFLHQFPLAYLGTPGTQSNADLFVSLGPRTASRNAVVDFPIICYLREIRRPIDDAERLVARYLNEHADPNDTVLSAYGDLSLQFYTGLKVIGGLQQPFPPQRISEWDAANWFFPRRIALGRDRNVSRFIWQRLLLRDLHVGLAIPFQPDCLARSVCVQGLHYSRVPVYGTDIASSNSPELQLHLFDVLSPSEANELFGLGRDAELELYQKRSDRTLAGSSNN
jgi:hypothetical protein